MTIRIRGVAIHATVTAERVLEAAERRMTSLDDPGFCILCGCEACGVEPDARRLTCESCGADCVYGSDDLLQRFAT